MHAPARAMVLLAALLAAGSAARAATPDPLDPALAPPVDQRAERYPASIWVTGAMAKVRRTDPPGLAHWALLSAARNETESFQVHVRAGAVPVRSVAVEVSDLVDARSGARIAASRHVTVSRELYQSIPSRLRSDQNGLEGDVPDALVPARDRTWGEVRNAFPADVPAGENLSAWVDVHVPRGVPSGWYVGSVVVRSGGTAIATLPVRLKVWNVDLPSTASLATHFAMSWNGACVQEHGSYEACGAATPSGSRDAGVEHYHLLYARFLLDRRVSLANVTYAGPRDDRWDRFDAAYGPLLDGSADTRLPGARLTTFTYAGNDDPATMGRWARHFRERGWLDRLVWYRCDEPGNGTCTFADARAEGDRVHSAAPGMRSLLTSDLENLTTHGLLDAVDVAVPVLDRMQPHDQPSRRPLYDAFLARSPAKRLFWYQSCDQHESCTNGRMGPAQATWPSYMVDASPMRNRIFQWMAFLERIHGELYYAVDYCFTRPCGPADAVSRDPFRSIYAFGGHGDGTLVYPGNTRTIGGTHHVPLSSIRLELIREGLEDFELLAMLARQGEGDLARARAASLIRRADEFASDPARLMAAREALGDRLHARSLGR